MSATRSPGTTKTWQAEGKERGLLDISSKDFHFHFLFSGIRLIWPKPELVIVGTVKRQTKRV